jgi:hypothetical protein
VIIGLLHSTFEEIKTAIVDIQKQSGVKRFFRAKEDGDAKIQEFLGKVQRILGKFSVSSLFVNATTDVGSTTSCHRWRRSWKCGKRCIR